MRLRPVRENKWPYLLSEGYKVTSDETWTYNCIAFAGDVNTQWWWPDQDGDAEWPIAERELTLECFIQAFASLGYTRCGDGRPDRVFEKVAIYAEDGVPTHAAKQLDDGRWKSKLGNWEDIEHNTTRAVEEYIYGKAVVYMRRRRPCQKTNLLETLRLFLSWPSGRPRKDPRDI